MSNFCFDGVLLNPKCYKLETFDFSSEESIFEILLDLLKSELPAKMANQTDCSGKAMYIAEKDIDIITGEGTPHFECVLNPLSANPSYTENRVYRTVEYNFELILTVHNENPQCLTWELLRFKNAVEGLVITAELVIDGYNSVDIELKGFEYFIPEQVGKAVYMRQGSYRFAVTVSQQKIN